MPAVLPPPIPVRANSTLTYATLREEAERAVERAKRAGKLKRDLAAELEVTPSAISFALANEGGRVAGLQRRILAHLTDYEIEEEPEFRVRKKAEG